MNKIKYLKRKIKELSLLTNIEEDIIVRQDNRLGKYTACIALYLYCDTHEPVYLLRYHMNKIKHMPIREILTLIFHELGHIKFKHEYETKKSREQMEYEAEKFAMVNIKNNYPRYYNKCLQDLGEGAKKSGGIYRRAFKKLYKELIQKG